MFLFIEVTPIEKNLCILISNHTALDAAQIGFEGGDPQVRLMKGDASFVDTYHTNGKPTVPTFGLGFVTDFGSFSN